MDKLQFKCGQCGKMMAVGSQLMGKQVSCPFCKKVVVAPMQAPVSAPAAPTPMPGSGHDMPMFKVPDQGEAESIFGAPEEDDPFESHRAPTVEMPAVHAPSPAPMNMPSNGSHEAMAPAPAGAFSNEPTAALSNFGGAEAGTAVADAPVNTGTANARALAQKRSKQDSLVTYYAMMILIPYAILMTIFTIYFYQKSKESIPIFYMLPDNPRDNKKPFNERVGIFVHPGIRDPLHTRVNDSAPLPDSLQVKMGETIALNELEVTPLKVEQKKVKFMQPGSAGQDSHNPAMVLTLRVKNISKEHDFAPNDLAFNRYSNQKKSPQDPYTCLEMGETRFYGGPCRWPKKPDKGEGWRQEDPLEWIDGTQAAPGAGSRILKPGEEMTMIVCTNPDVEGKFQPGGKGLYVPTEVIESVNRNPGPFLWRVQLRTGVLEIDDKIGTVTSVFGVKFQKSDIKQPG